MRKIDRKATWPRQGQAINGPTTGAEVVADPFEAERLAAAGLHSPTRRRGRLAGQTGHPIRGGRRPGGQHARPAAGEADQRLGQRADGITDDRDRLAAFESVGQPAGKTLHDVLARLGDPLDDADDRRARPECLR